MFKGSRVYLVKQQGTLKHVTTVTLRRRLYIIRVHSMLRGAPKTTDSNVIQPCSALDYEILKTVLQKVQEFHTYKTGFSAGLVF